MSAATKRSILSIATGALVLLSCELPILLSIAGLGAYATNAEALKPPQWLEMLGLMAIIVGGLGLAGYAVAQFRRRYKKT